MILRKMVLSLALIAGVALAGCEGMQNGQLPDFNKQNTGAVVGAVAGGLAGSKIGGGSGQLWATGAGALLGALVGSEIGKSLDKADLGYAAKAQQQAYVAPIGQSIAWNNPDSGNSGTYTPVRDGTSASGAYCREYQQTIYVGGQQETATGTACQQPDGSWKIIN